MIIEAVAEGMLLGLVLAIQPGPSFWAILQTGGKLGFKPGLGLAIGILISDIFYVSLSYLGVAQLFDNPESEHYIGLGGGLILVIFGLSSLIQKKEKKKEVEEINEVSMPLYIVKGFFLNVLNPVVFLLWIGCVAKLSSNTDYTETLIILFFASALSTIFFADTLKAYYANKISQRLSDNVLHYVNILLGLILLITGLVFLYNVFFP